MMLEKFFQLKEHKTTIGTEFLAGVTTFFAMSYILFVNPQILGQTGMPQAGVFMATILSTIAGTLMMALYANLPYAQAPGLGINAFFAFTVVGTLGYSWQEALAMVFLCGVISMIVTVTKARKMIIAALPESMQHAVSGGIGIFLAYVGLKNAGFLKFTADPGTYQVLGDKLDPATSGIVASSATIPGLVSFNQPMVLLGLFGLLVTIFFVVRQFKAGIVLSMALTTIAAIFIGVVNLSTIDFGAVSLSSALNDLKDLAFVAVSSEGLGSLFADPGRIPEVLLTILTFALTDIFDNIGTLIGTGRQAGIFNVEDEEAAKHSSGLNTKMEKALFADTLGTTVGALAGTSNVTTFVESAAGIGVGGRTGLTALVVAGLFALSSFFSPLLALVPTAATAPILIIVGIMMLSNMKHIKWDQLEEAIPAFFASIFMGLTYSITHGIAVGLLAYTIIKLYTGKVKEVHPVIWILDILFLVDFIHMALI